MFIQSPVVFGLLLTARMAAEPSFPVETIAIIGGTGVSGVNQVPYAALIDSLGTVHLLPNLPNTGNNQDNIVSVAMNASGNSIMAGHQGTGGGGGGTYAALVDSIGNVRVVSSFANAGLFAAAINSSGNAIGVGTTGDPFGFRVDPKGNPTSFFLSSGGFSATALADSGLAIVGGNGQGVTGYYLPPPDSTTLSPSPPGGLGYTGHPFSITSISVNSSENFVIGGSAPYCNFYGPAGNLLQTVHLGVGHFTHSVAINNSNIALIGGKVGVTAYASLINPSSSTPQLLSGDPLPATGSILSVDLNNSGYGIIGGHHILPNPSAFGAFVDPSGVVHTIPGLPSGSNASINSVSINSWGVALLGGTYDGVNSFTALATPWGGLAVLDVNTPQPILSVSLRDFFPFERVRQLARTLLAKNRPITGNNLVFGKYITQEAPGKIRYFIPSVFEGTLGEALQNAAPTRNSLSTFAVTNNLFLLNQSLSTHIRNHFRFPRTKTVVTPQASASATLTKSSDVMLALADTNEQQNVRDTLSPVSKTSRAKPRPRTVWFEPIGAFIAQKEQHQTVGFEPAVGGFILGFAKKPLRNTQVGGGAAYTFTHIYENEDSGFSNINQEYIFLYGAWSNRDWYLDAALWGGLFQIRQVRRIHMTGFDFRSASNPKGTQVSPHLEFGYNWYKRWGTNQQYALVIDPFAMGDWPNSWQRRYQETGSGPFNATQKANHCSFLRAEAGCRFYEAIEFDVWILTLEEKGSYVYKRPFDVGSVHAFLVGSPGAFTVETLTSTQNLGAVELSFLFEPIHPAYPYGSIGYQGEFGHKYQSHQVTGEVSWDF